jgi:hypothetical protein
MSTFKKINEMTNIQSFDEFISEAKKDVTAEELRNFLEATYKSDGDKKKYSIEVDKLADRDENPAHVTFSYDLYTKKGHARASEDIHFDLNTQTWFDNYTDGGDMKGLSGTKAAINKHIRTEKKEITG